MVRAERLCPFKLLVVWGLYSLVVLGFSLSWTAAAVAGLAVLVWTREI